MKGRKLFRSCKGKSLNAIVKILCGEKIGSGLYRDVFVFKGDSNYVVKVERDPGTSVFANVTEWRNYIHNKEYTWFEKWLAPCEMINEDGRILIQRRIEHGRRKDYPKWIPVAFTDKKLSNFGWIGKRFVCCDYSTLRYTYEGRKMQSAQWWGTLKHLKKK